VANTLAYYDMATIIAVKSFIVQAPGLTFVGKAKVGTIMNSTWVGSDKNIHTIDTHVLAFNKNTRLDWKNLSGFTL